MFSSYGDALFVSFSGHRKAPGKGMLSLLSSAMVGPEQGWTFGKKAVEFRTERGERKGSDNRESPGARIRGAGERPDGARNGARNGRRSSTWRAGETFHAGGFWPGRIS